MQSINVFENGIEYLSECLSLYLGACGYLMLFLLGIVYILIKGSDEEKEIFIPGTVLLVLTVYNPIAPVILDKIFDVSSEYYRLFWIAPVIILVPFVASKIICSTNTRREKIISITFVCLAFVFSGDFVYKNGIPFAQNVYKVPDELIEIDEIIRSDADSEYTKAFFEYEYNMEIRQYDPKILLTIDREEYIYAVNYSYTDEMLSDEAVPTNKLLAALVRNQNVDAASFKKALEETKTEYVVLTKGNYQTKLLAECGLSVVGDTDMHVVYKYTMEEPYEYELVDYTGIEHKFSYRRLK